MPLPESRHLPRESSISPTVRKQVYAMLTGGPVGSVFIVIAFYDKIKEDFSLLEVSLLVSLFLAVFTLLSQLLIIKEHKENYRTAVAAIYENHPITDKGIDIQYARPRTDPTHKVREFDVLIRIDRLEGKVLLFTCVGNIGHVCAFMKPAGERLFSVSRDEAGKVRAEIFTRNMFEVDPQGEAGNLCLRIDDGNVRIACIEWRDPHVS